MNSIYFNKYILLSTQSNHLKEDVNKDCYLFKFALSLESSVRSAIKAEVILFIEIN